MFDDMTLSTAERVTVRPAPKAMEQFRVLVATAWTEQVGSDRNMGHFVRLASEEQVKEFHKQARIAAHELKYGYRKLSRVGSDAEPTTAYFKLTELDDDVVGADAQSHDEPKTGRRK